MANHTTPETAWPVRELNSKVKGWIERLGYVWVEGQITQYKANNRWKFSYLTLRDPEIEASIQITCNTTLLTSADNPIAQGDRVVVYGKPSFYEGRGSFSLWVTEIRPVGIGAMLARIEQLRRRLATEGLFDDSRKHPLPFLPNNIGLITGRGSAAERDVLSVSQGRWPDVQFTIINTAVQGARAVPEIIAALTELDANPDVDVIIIARGGGSVEDLLPFSTNPTTPFSTMLPTCGPPPPPTPRNVLCRTSWRSCNKSGSFAVGPPQPSEAGCPANSNNSRPFVPDRS